MATVGEPLRRSPFGHEQHGYPSHYTKSIPILPSITASGPDGGEPMDVSQPSNGPMPPPATSSPPRDRQVEQSRNTQGEQQHNQGDQPNASGNGGGQPVGAAAAAQQPKVVQTAFIHKLYNMLEDQSIQHLISWSSSNESFVMSPSSEFSKVLAQYFKHTNISSFVRQLNMYGFHKVSDVFHTGSPDSPLWEFKHGGGNFKRGDLVGLREIKRRASRHALIHRDSFPAPAPPKMPTPAPAPPPANGMEPMQDPVEARLNMLEWNMNDAFGRLARSEEAYAALTNKCQTLLDGLNRCHQWNQELSSHLLTLVPDPDNPVHRQVYTMHQEIFRQAEQLKSMEQSQDSLFGNKDSYFQTPNLSAEQGPPMSPRQRPLDESRRPSLQATLGRPSSFKSAMPAHLQVSPRRYGSIGTGSGTNSPLSTRPTYLPPPPPPPPQQHPLANTMTSPPPASLARRHTSADIRVPNSWNGQNQHYAQGSSPYASGQSSAAWPSSPKANAQQGDQSLRDSLASYELSRASNTHSRHPSPPPPHDAAAPPSFASSFGGSYANPNDAGWQIPSARSFFKGLDTGPPTRRSSMASNVHSLLNPADTAEREGEDEGPTESAKRKRVQ